MIKALRATLTLAIVAAVAAPVLAQPPGGRGGFGGGMSGAMLLSQKSVQDELKLSEDQVKKITDLGQKMRASFGGLQGLSREEIQKKMEESRKESEKALAEILKPEQAKRLKEITFQLSMRQGVGTALANPELVKELGLSEDQKEALQALQADARKFREELGIRFGQRPTEEQQKKQDEFRKGQETKVMKLLSEDQKAKLKSLGGAEFKGEIAPPRRPGGGAGN